MPKISRALFLCLSASVLVWLCCGLSCVKLPAQYEGNPQTRISTGAGPEDIVEDPLYNRLLVSCDARRSSEPQSAGIWAITAGSDKAFELKRTAEPENLVFHPHGVDLRGDTLYIISHDDEQDVHSILKYKLAESELRYLGALNNYRLNSPNALTVLPGGDLLITNDSGKRGSTMEALFRKRKSTIVHYSARTKEWTYAADDMAYANGINFRGDKVYIATTRSHHVYQFTLLKDTLVERKIVADIKGLDNLRWHQDELLTTSHPNVLQFVKHAKNAAKKSNSEIWGINPETREWRRLFSSYNGNEHPISGASTAIIFNDALYIGQVFDPFVLKIDLSASN